MSTINGYTTRSNGGSYALAKTGFSVRQVRPTLPTRIGASYLASKGIRLSSIMPRGHIELRMVLILDSAIGLPAPHRGSQRSRFRCDTMKKLGTFQFTATGNDLAYLKLPDYPTKVPGGEPIRVARSINVMDLIRGYVGPDVRLDFMADGTLIAIEIMY